MMDVSKAGQNIEQELIRAHWKHIMEGNFSDRSEAKKKKEEKKRKKKKMDGKREARD